MPDNSASLPDFTRWPSFPFEGDMRVKPLAAPVEVEPPRSGEEAAECVACGTTDDSYIWVSERWRVRSMDRPTGLPMVLILECRSHLDLGDLTNLLAAELGVMTVRLERAIRSLDGVARVHVNRWGDGSAHLHLWFLARPYGRLQLRGTFLSLWDDILPVIPEPQWRENLALVAAWLADFGGQAIAEPPHIQWESPSTIAYSPKADADTGPDSNAGTATPAPRAGTETPNPHTTSYAPIPRQTTGAPNADAGPSTQVPTRGPGVPDAGVLVTSSASAVSGTGSGVPTANPHIPTPTASGPTPTASGSALIERSSETADTKSAGGPDAVAGSESVGPSGGHGIQHDDQRPTSLGDATFTKSSATEVAPSTAAVLHEEPRPSEREPQATT